MTAAARRFTLAGVAILASMHLLNAVESPQKAFIRQWEGRIVVVKRPLYTLVYNERGRLGNTNSNKRDGLTVITPSKGVYFQFDGRQGRDDVVAQDPQRIIEAVDVQYRPDSLELRSYRKIETVVLNRYDPGIELVVSRVQFEKDTVRLLFAQRTKTAIPGSGPDSVSGNGEVVTALTVKWPLPLSNNFTERDRVEALIDWFIGVKPA